MEYIPRTDQYGRPVSLGLTPANRRSVLFTGRGGSGKSNELDRAEAGARAQGHEVIRVKAIGGERLYNQVYRALVDELDGMKKRQPGHWGRHPIQAARDWGQMRRLKRTMNEMTGVREARQRQNLIGLGRALPVFATVGESSVRMRELPRARMSDLADRLGEIAGARGKQAVIMIDDLHSVDQQGLAWVNELARHLEKNQSNVHLAAAGRPQVIGQMMTATGGESGAQHDPTRLFEIRELQPANPDLLPGAMMRDWYANGVHVAPDAAGQLLAAANGNLQRLEDLQRTAMQGNGLLKPMPEGSQIPSYLDSQGATAAIQWLHTMRAPFYAHGWKAGNDEDREVLSRVAAKGLNGLNVRDLFPADEMADPDSKNGAKAGAEAEGQDQEKTKGTAKRPDEKYEKKLAELNNARQRLVDNGWLQQSQHGHLSFADPGMQQWVTQHLATNSPHLTPERQEEAQRAAQELTQRAPWLVPVGQDAIQSGPQQAAMVNRLQAQSAAPAIGQFPGHVPGQPPARVPALQADGQVPNPYQPQNPQPTSQPWPQQPYAQPGYPQPGYPQNGYPQPWNQPGHPQLSFQQLGYPQPQQPGYPQPGYQQPGYPQPGYQQPGYQQPGYQQQGYPQPQQSAPQQSVPGAYPPPVPQQQATDQSVSQPPQHPGAPPAPESASRQPAQEPTQRPAMPPNAVSLSMSGQLPPPGGRHRADGPAHQPASQPQQAAGQQPEQQQSQHEGQQPERPVDPRIALAMSGQEHLYGRHARQPGEQPAQPSTERPATPRPGRHRADQRPETGK